MRYLVLVLFNVFCLVQSVVYIKPNYTARPLSKDENKELLKMCGREPAFIEAESTSQAPKQKLMNSEAVDKTTVPWAVQLLYANKWSPNMSNEEVYLNSGAMCSSSLISPRHVLSAGHCLFESLHRVTFVFTRLAKNVNESHPIFLRRTLKAYKSIKHNEHTEKSPNSLGDVSVYELTEDVTFHKEVYPICLGDYETKIGEEFDFYGFGGNGATPPSHLLRHAKLNSVKCNFDAPPEQLVDMFCAYAKYQKLCSGDSGGGLVHTSHGTKSVVAVASFIRGLCALKNELEVFGEDGMTDYLADVRPHLYWICETTGVCANKAVEEEVAMWSSLPNRNRERYATYSAKDEFNIFV